MSDVGQLPKVNLSAMEKQRDRLGACLLPWLSKPVVPDELSLSLCDCLPAGAVYDAVFESVRSFSGRPLQPSELNGLVWRMAGNVGLLKAGVPVREWSHQRADEWVPVVVLSSVYKRRQKAKNAFLTTFLVLSGTPAGLKVTTWLTQAAAAYIAARIGFSNRRGRFPFHSPVELVGLRLFAMVSRERSRGRPVFSEYQATGGMQSWNRENILRLRLRAGVTCPEGFQHRCSVCAVGYDRCSAGTHPATYVFKLCDGCGVEGFFDPLTSLDFCLGCCNRGDHIS